MPFHDQTHTAEYRIYYEDTDAGGIVYHANYLKYAERARSDALRELEVHQHVLREELGIFFVLRHADITYHKPLLLDDMITVKSQIIDVGNSSLKMQQTLFKEELEVCSMLMHIVCVSNEKKAVRIPSLVLDKLRHHMMCVKETDE